jgi:hypothetical protein
VPKPTGPPVFFPAVSPGMRAAAIGVAASDGGFVHLELAEHAGGTSWFLERAAELKTRYPQAIWACESAGQIGVFLPELKEIGIEPELFTTTEMGRAAGHMQKLVADKAVTITHDQALTAALAGAVKRDVGDSLWTWGWRKSSVDVSPLVVITGAAWAHRRFVEEPTADVF